MEGQASVAEGFPSLLLGRLGGQPPGKKMNWAPVRGAKSEQREVPLGPETRGGKRNPPSG